ncbi:hypothetical protein [Paenibacillus sp. NPDC058177]|uniref:DUF7638 domain-containing protein n=1 Tax=Paenibacillus sp. NPDC058177 TaxID=3346369 RepID=UPI0036D81A37
MQRISRQKRIEGTRVPGIINNNQYFYINVDVYEDGMVNCWELVDLTGAKEKLEAGWLVTRVPEGESLSIHGLGAYKIASAEWAFDETSYLRYLQDTVRTLNPELENLYTISVRDKQQHGRRVIHSPNASEFYVQTEQFYQTAAGDGFTMFLKHEGQNYIANIVVYEDGLVSCYTPAFEWKMTLDEVGDLFRNGTLFTSFTESTTVRFDNLGIITFDEVLYSAEPEEKYKELANAYQKLSGGETSLEKCRQAYYSYLEYPTDHARARLKELYEEVPEHERMYLGDMDIKDYDYARIIYNPEEKREV